VKHKARKNMIKSAKIKTRMNNLSMKTRATSLKRRIFQTVNRRSKTIDENIIISLIVI